MRIFLDNNQIFGAGGQNFNAIFAENAGIFNSDTEFTGQIDTGLCRSNCTGGHAFGVTGGGVGCFMDFQTQAVAGAMTEILPVAGIRDHLAGSAVDILTGNACLGSSQKCYVESILFCKSRGKECVAYGCLYLLSKYYRIQG